MKQSFALTLLLLASTALANPYFDETQVPKDSRYGELPRITSKPVGFTNAKGLEVFRASARVDIKSETYSLATLTREFSGTQAFAKRAKKASPWGSYRGYLKNSKGKVLATDSIGTGKEFRKLVDAITFRFPFHSGDLVFEVEAENPLTGKMEKVFEHRFSSSQVGSVANAQPVQIREIKPAAGADSIRVNIYAEGYLANRMAQFFADAEKTVAALVNTKFPMVDKMHFFAVFARSNKKLGVATNLGLPVLERDSFLGLYFPYWNDFGRWYHIVYPTREEKYRRGLATAPYDYSIVLIDDNAYWGVGNFREITAIPSQNSSFVYLLLHEIGHYFGLNEEYDDYGRTELEFAPQIDEPWSQNITFLRSKNHSDLKWKNFVSMSVQLPTSKSSWRSYPPVYGAYPGGYAQSEPHNHSHKPGLNCIMDRYADFCDICKKGIADVINFDSGTISTSK